MNAKSNVFPERITPDAILEALVEFRIEHEDLSELMIGRLLDLTVWEGYSRARLPTADIPQPIRDMDLGLRYQPSFELRSPDGNRVAKVGGHAVSYHIVGPYPGWKIFSVEISSVIRAIITKLKAPKFGRIGFRYINVFRRDEHQISGISDTNVRVLLGNECLTESLNVNYTRKIGSHHSVTVKIATPDLVPGLRGPSPSLLCDIDVGSSDGVEFTNYETAYSWIEEAHVLEKSEFFTLLPDHVIEKLAAAPGDNTNG